MFLLGITGNEIKNRIESSSYPFTNLGQGGLFRSQLSYRLVVSYVDIFNAMISPCLLHDRI
jgi:hypothetical protein